MVVQLTGAFPGRWWPGGIPVRPRGSHSGMEFADYIRTPKCDRVVLHQPLSAPLDGTLCITGHHFIFSSRQTEAQEVWVRIRDAVGRI